MLMHLGRGFRLELNRLEALVEQRVAGATVAGDLVATGDGPQPVQEPADALVLGRHYRDRVGERPSAGGVATLGHGLDRREEHSLLLGQVRPEVSLYVCHQLAHFSQLRAPVAVDRKYLGRQSASSGSSR